MNKHVESKEKKKKASEKKETLAAEKKEMKEKVGKADHSGNHRYRG